jgi:hypothetical protein
VGWVTAQAGARAGLGLGGVTCLIVAVVGLLALHRQAVGSIRSRFAVGTR